MRVDVFQALRNAEKNLDKSSLNPEQSRLVEKMLLEGKRAGLELPEEKREKLKKVRPCFQAQQLVHLDLHYS